jgi:nitrite reductase/ring-hydroxylating ferredoxin subunit
MAVKFLQRSILQRILGMPATSKPMDPEGWHFADGNLTIDLKRTPELGQPGNAVRLEGGNLPKRVLVVYGEDQRYYAFHNRCRHFGHRRLDFVPGTSTVQCCSINKSTYNFSGEKIHGPAPGPIASYPVTVEADKLIVRIS